MAKRRRNRCGPDARIEPPTGTTHHQILMGRLAVIIRAVITLNPNALNLSRGTCGAACVKA